MADYKSLCVVAIIHSTLVDIQTYTHTDTWTENILCYAASLACRVMKYCNPRKFLFYKSKALVRFSLPGKLHKI